MQTRVTNRPLGGRRRLSAALTALVLGVVGVAAPASAQTIASVAPASLGFGNVEVGTTSAGLSVTVTHFGKQLNLVSVTVAAPFVTAGTTCPAIGTPPIVVNQTCTVSFAFAPSTTGAASTTAAILVLIDGRLRVPLTVSLSGNGVTSPKPSLTITPVVLDFANVAVGSTLDVGATVTNTGNVPLAPTATPVSISGGQAGDFAVVASACGALAAGASCAVTVRFTPGAEGARSSSLVASYLYQPVAVVAVVPPQPVGATARLTGTGTPRPKAGLSLNPPTADFGPRPVGSASAPAGFTAKNTGNAPGKVTTVSVTGAAAGDFAIASNACANLTLAPNATCQVGVTFKPGAAGPRTASLGVAMAEGPTASSLLNGAGTAPALAFEPPAVDVGNVLVGTPSPATVVTARNTGNASGKIVGVGLGGAAAAEWALGANACTGATLAPSATCTFSVTLTPAVPGARPAIVGGTMAEGPQATASLTGNGISPNFEVDPPDADFGTTFVNTETLAFTITVRSTGTAPVTITGYLVDGAQSAEFTTVGGTCTAGTVLDPGATCTVLVVARPAAVGQRVGRLLVAAGALQDASQLRVAGLAAPVIEMVPPLGQAGRMTTVVGRDFPANAMVRLGWVGGSTVEVVTDAAGTLRLPVLVLHHEVRGPRDMQATSVDGSFPSPTADYMVMAPTVRPHGLRTTVAARRFVTRG